MSDISLAWSMSSSGIEVGVVEDATEVVGVMVVVDVDGVVASVVGPNTVQGCCFFSR